MDKKDWIIDCREDNNKMKILVINCHCDNRGDEAAIHAMVDELIEIIYKFEHYTSNTRDWNTIS